MDNNRELEKLYERYLKNDLTFDELQAFFKLLNQAQNEELLNKLLDNTWTATNETADPDFSATQREQIEYPSVTPVVKMPAGERKRFVILKWAAAVILLLSAGTWYFTYNNDKIIASTDKTNRQDKQDIQPGGDRAQLLFDDGTAIMLDTAKDGIITQANGIIVTKSDDGKIEYSTINRGNKIHYSTMVTPRGGQYQLTLADGSKAWLNAASSIKFPSAFTGKEREVEITGEVYFEVTKNTSMPFKVNVAGKGEVEVLGTHFNINSYTDEATINTTLLEGSVKVTGLTTRPELQSKDSRLITPGQQAQLNSNGQISLNKNPDIDEVMAWKNSLFNFNSLDIEMIMRQISRWYDVDISYEGKISKETYSGIVSRNSNLSQVLKAMEEGGVKFSIEGKKIVVH